MTQQNAIHSLHRKMFVISVIFLMIELLALQTNVAAQDMAESQATVASHRYLTIRPPLSNDVILNPGKGWILYGLPANHSASTMHFATVGYMRYDWSDIEPQEGRYNWAMIDYALHAWEAQGKQFAFGVMNADSTRWNVPYITPHWVFADGAAYVKSQISDALTHKTSVQYVPRWNDPIFLQKVKNFLTALALRYDTNLHIAFIDVRSYGNWGEQHTYGISSSTSLTAAGVLLHIQLYRDAFKHVQIIVPWGAPDYNNVYNWAINNKVGLRRDGVMVDSNGSELRRAFAKSPAIIEFYGSYQWLVNNGYWSEAKLLTAVQNGRPSYIGMGQWGNDAEIMLAHEYTLIRDLTNRMGYFFVLKRATIPTVISNNQATRISLAWYNQGVAYLYKPGKLAVALLDSSNHVVQQQWFTGSHPNAWTPGSITQENTTITFSHVQPGRYKLAIGLFQNTQDHNPTYQIGNQGRTANGWYVLSSNVTVAANVLLA